MKRSSAKSVFINCPFDPEYERLFQAICLSVLACRMIPRCALEFSDASHTRIDRLYELISECDLGIHDVSRTECKPFPRFNMPFELGLFLGAKRFGRPPDKRKKVLILDRKRYRYQRFLSDLGGQDVKAHDGGPQNMTRIVRSWLRSNSEAPCPSESFVLRCYRNYRHWRPRIIYELGTSHPDFKEEIEVMVKSIQDS